MDNLKVHSSDETRKYLATVLGRFEFVFTPKHGSWLNLIEGFFSKLARQMLKGIRVKTKDELVQRIYKYFDEVNEEPAVYHWKYKLEEIDPSEVDLAYCSWESKFFSKFTQTGICPLVMGFHPINLCGKQLSVLRLCQLAHLLLAAIPAA